MLKCISYSNFIRYHNLNRMDLSKTCLIFYFGYPLKPSCSRKVQKSRNTFQSQFIRPKDDRKEDDKRYKTLAKKKRNRTSCCNTPVMFRKHLHVFTSHGHSENSRTPKNKSNSVCFFMNFSSISHTHAAEHSFQESEIFVPGMR